MMMAALTLVRRLGRSFVSWDDGRLTAALIAFAVVADLALSFIIVKKVKYTEIDWEAYMSEVEGPFVHGEFDYVKLKGGTGPLVYPAGFVYAFALLRLMTDGGKNILRAQYIFCVLHAAFVALVMWSYRAACSKAKKPVIPPWAMLLVCASRRVHSIFVLRLFNDGVTMILAFIAINLFLRRRWFLGCTFFSLAFSTKMNVFLFAPALAVVLVQAVGFKAMVALVAWCGAIQVALGAPFMLVNASGYLNRSFELGRVFFHKWTVNFKFLDEATFQSSKLAAALLVLCAAAWVAFGHFKWMRQDGGFLSLFSPRHWNRGRALSNEHILSALFASNFVGIVFARSLHYQFYCWYCYTIPWLAWMTPYPDAVKVVIFAAIEVCFNIYPSTPASSIALQILHAALLIGVWMGPNQDAYANAIDNCAGAVIRHMNKDHADAVVAMAESYGGASEKETKGATMTDFSQKGFHIRLPSMNRSVFVGFKESGYEEPQTRLHAREVIVKMFKEAR